MLHIAICDDQPKELEITCAEGHGVGSKSVIAFAKKYDGELLYKIDNNVFQVRLLV